MTPTETKTLRDEFAMAALAGMTASNACRENIIYHAKNKPGNGDINQIIRELYCEAAYELADEMMKQRTK